MSLSRVLENPSRLEAFKYNLKQPGECLGPHLVHWMKFTHSGLSMFGEIPVYVLVWDAEGVGKWKSELGSVKLSFLTIVRAGPAP